MGETIRKWTNNNGLCMMFSILNAFVSRIVVIKFYILVFVGGVATIDGTDFCYCGMKSVTSLAKEKGLEPETTPAGYRDLYVAKRRDSRSGRK